MPPITSCSKKCDEYQGGYNVLIERMESFKPKVLNYFGYFNRFVNGNEPGKHPPLGICIAETWLLFPLTGEQVEGRKMPIWKATLLQELVLIQDNRLIWQSETRTRGWKEGSIGTDVWTLSHPHVLFLPCLSPSHLVFSFSINRI